MYPIVLDDAYRLPGNAQVVGYFGWGKQGMMMQFKNEVRSLA